MDPLTYRREHLAALAAAASAPPGTSSMQLSGGAGPKGVLAPDEREAARLASLHPEVVEKELGASSALAGASGVAIRHEILAAAVAMQEGDTASAVKLQASAVRACAGVPRLAHVLELILGTYRLQAGDELGARKTFQAVATRCEQSGLLDLASLAFTSLGASLAASSARSDLRAAASHYLSAGNLAQSASEPILAVESYRMAGTLAARAGDEDGAISAWKRALASASAAPLEIAALTSGPLVARTLAKFLQTNGSPAAATSLLAQADEMERAKPRASAPPEQTPRGPDAGRPS